MLRLLITFSALALLITACPKQTTTPPSAAPSAPPPATASQAPPMLSESELVARGQEIFTGKEYSATGLTCAMCHSLAPSMDEGKIYIASTAYGAAGRGAWRVHGEDQLAAGTGDAPTLEEAAALCVSAPYMNSPQPLSAEDGQALAAFYKSIGVPEARDGAAFLSAENYPMPAAGLTPDREHGRVIYETSCRFCHDNGIEGLPGLVGAKDWLKPIQVMAKVRKAEGDWYNGFKDQTYAGADPLARQLALLGISPAYAQEAEAEPPAGGMEPGAEPAGEAEEEDEAFPENAMPGYAPAILTDQDVVDVAFYVAEEM